jgi:twitching motility two-component system response regulator PilG
MFARYGRFGAGGSGQALLGTGLVPVLFSAHRTCEPAHNYNSPYLIHRAGCFAGAGLATTGRADRKLEGALNMTTADQDAILKGVKVLVIDDSKTIRRTAENLLKKAGCEVSTAADGFEALGRIVDDRPDVIFVDIMMPRLDGYQTCALIKHNPELRHTPVIMLSSKDGLFDRAKGRIVGAEQYLTKPFTRDEILGAIRRYTQKAA